MVVGADAGTHVLVKSLSASAPGAMTGKWGTALNVASLLAAPFTGGGSLAANAALRGGAVAVQGARAGLAGKKAAQAGKGLTAAQGASATAQANKVPVRRKPYTKRGQAQSMADVSSGKTTQLSDFGDIGDVTEGAGSKVGVTPQAEGGSYFDNLGERSTEGQQGLDTDPAGANAPEQTTFNDKTIEAYENQNIAQEHADKMAEQHKQMKEQYDKSKTDQTSPMAMATTGAYGFNQLQGRHDANQAKQQAEMERIQNISEDGKANSTTGGGKVAVA